jgi:hypothetical protein
MENPLRLRELLEARPVLRGELMQRMQTGRLTFVILARE